MYTPSLPLATYPKQATYSSVKNDAFDTITYFLKVEPLILEDIMSPLPRITYDTKTGVGFTNNISFQLKSDQKEFIILPKLIKRAGKPISRETILESLGYPNGNVDILKSWSSDTIYLTELAKSLRKKIKIKSEYLVINLGSLTLRAVIVPTKVP